MSTDSLFTEKFNHHFIKIDEEINLSFNSRVPLVENIGKHSLSGAGKRIRPLLFVLVCGMCKYERDDIYHVSTLFEHMHTASLLHDDVIDKSEVRRGLSSFWVKKSVSGAILGTIFIRVLNDLTTTELVPLISDTWPSMSAEVSASMGPLTFGLIIMLFLIFEPRGIIHRWELFKAYYRLWPFAHAPGGR